MTTNSKNNGIRTGARSHPEQAVPNTHSNAEGTATMYEAVLCHTGQHATTVLIAASSRQEAREKARKMNPDDIYGWVPFGGELIVESVEPYAEGGAMDCQQGAAAIIQTDGTKNKRTIWSWIHAAFARDGVEPLAAVRDMAFGFVVMIAVMAVIVSGMYYLMREASAEKCQLYVAFIAAWAIMGTWAFVFIYGEIVSRMHDALDQSGYRYDSVEFQERAEGESPKPQTAPPVGADCSR